jgi:hypothetical protein
LIGKRFPLAPVAKFNFPAFASLLMVERKEKGDRRNKTQVRGEKNPGFKALFKDYVDRFR